MLIRTPLESVTDFASIASSCPTKLYMFGKGRTRAFDCAIQSGENSMELGAVVGNVKDIFTKYSLITMKVLAHININTSTSTHK